MKAVRTFATVTMLLLAACARAPSQTASPSPVLSPALSPTVTPAQLPSPVVETPVVRPPVTPDPAPRVQTRGVWVHLFDDTLKTAGGIDGMLDKVAVAGANTVIAQVARRHDAYYVSSVLPRTPDPALEEGLDVLAHLVAGARARGLAVHAWFAAAPTYHHAYDDLPRPDGWVWAEHGPRAPEEDRWVTRDHEGRWGEYLDPGVPDVRAHVAAVAGELASRYDIDAVHLDYARYDGSRWGYHPVALGRFGTETGRSDVPSPTDPQWSQWRREQTRELVREVRDAIGTTALSAAVIAQGEGPHAGKRFEQTIAYAEKLQDWPSWLRDGVIDAAYPMAYFRDTTHASWFEQWTSFAAGLGPKVSIGLGAWLNSPEASERQLARAAAATGGAVVYSYQQNASAAPYDALLARLGTGAWSHPARAPAMR